MGILSTIRGWISMLLPARAKEAFNVRGVTNAEVDAYISRCAKVYRGMPDWLDPDEHIRTINFAKSVCSETARLATLAIGITVTGSARADWIQQQINGAYFNLRHWVEYGCAYGTVILKPNGDSIDMVLPGNFMVTNCENGEITGAVFMSQRYDPLQKRWFTRLEHHGFLENGNYAVQNRCYVSDSQGATGKPVAIEKTPWIGLIEDTEMQGVERPLFGVFRTPMANNLDTGSPLGLPVFADALEELKDLDVAYSRNAKEIADSKRTVLLDSDRLMPTGGKVLRSAGGYRQAADALGLPDYVKAVDGTGDAAHEIYHEINPSLNTDARLTGINALLSQIGYKCGYSNGYFVFNEQTGLATATQVEADQQRTIQLIKDVRDKLENCLDGLIYALDKFADLYDLAPVGVYEVACDFGDITYNEDEDRARWLGYVTQGKVPFWYYLTRFEGFTEEDARNLEASAKGGDPELFGAEE